MNKILYCLSKKNITFVQDGVKPKVFYKKVGIKENINTSYLSTSISSINLNHSINPFLLSPMSQKYYSITLDDRVMKTIYLDEMKINNKYLALGIMDEWQSQKAFINYYSMHFNLYFASGTKLVKDTQLKNEIKNKLITYINTDQITFLENKWIKMVEKKENVELNITKVYDYMKKDFNIEMSNNDDDNKKNEVKLNEQLELFDPFSISLLEHLCGITKSISISLALMTNVIDVKQAYLISFSEEIFQMNLYGEVEGYHDILEKTMKAALGSASSFFNLLKINI